MSTGWVSMDETGYSDPVHWDNPAGWDGEGSGRGIVSEDIFQVTVDDLYWVAFF